MDASELPPRAGSGLHLWILDFTRKALLAGLPEEDTLEHTFELTRHAGRAPNHLRKEIKDAIAGAVVWIAAHPGIIIPGRPRTGPTMPQGVSEMAWASYCPDEILRDVQPPPRARWKKPVQPRKTLRILHGPEPEFHPLPEEEFSLVNLYGGGVYDFNICLAGSVYEPRARSLEFWEKRPRSVWGSWQWMVPNPCLECGDEGWVKSDENADERIWLIVEFDSGSLRDQRKLLAWLGRNFEGWELALVVYSGGKSLHGWYSCVGKEERSEILPFFQMATALGADLAMSSSVQYTRVPWGTNTKTGIRQKILHWDAAAIERHNCNLNKHQNLW